MPNPASMPISASTQNLINQAYADYANLSGIISAASASDVALTMAEQDSTARHAAVATAQAQLAADTASAIAALAADLGYAGPGSAPVQQAPAAPKMQSRAARPQFGLTDILNIVDGAQKLIPVLESILNQLKGVVSVVGG